MPLLKGRSRAVISKNIATERRAGKPEKQAIAIAENTARNSDVIQPEALGEGEVPGRDSLQSEAADRYAWYRKMARPVLEKQYSMVLHQEADKAAGALALIRAMLTWEFGARMAEDAIRGDYMGKATDKWGRAEEQEYFKIRKKLESEGMSKLRAHEEAMRRMGCPVKEYQLPATAFDDLRPVPVKGRARDTGMGVCPVCRRAVQIDGDEVIASHQGGRAAVCPGSGSPPLLATAKDAVGWPYEVEPYRIWVNKKTGRTASIFGAVPYTSSAERADWSMEPRGYTVVNKRTGTRGIGRQPFSTEADAQAWADKENERLATYWKPNSTKDSLRPVSMDEHEGFAKLKNELSHEKGVHDPGAVAAAIGRKKYGKAGMARKAAAGRAKDRELRPV